MLVEKLCSDNNKLVHCNFMKATAEPGDTPSFVEPPRRVPLQKQAMIDEELDNKERLSTIPSFCRDKSNYSTVGETRAQSVSDEELRSVHSQNCHESMEMCPKIGEQPKTDCLRDPTVVRTYGTYVETEEQRAAAQSCQRVAEELRQQQLDFQPLLPATGSSSLHQTAWARRQKRRSFPPRPGESWHQQSTGQLAVGSSQQQEQLQRPPPADTPVVPPLPVSSAPWAEEDCELLGCLKSDDIGSVSVQCPVALSSVQSVEVARSKGPKLASTSTPVVSAQQASNSKENTSSLLPSFETVETQQANVDCFTLSSVVNSELRATIRRLEATTEDGRTADSDGRSAKGGGDDQQVVSPAATKSE
ncbi:MAG: hypothetical protein GY738_30770 [Pseudoalteromonas sp.]|nr:hypothetical protein [Pseudoalteromonas sp.]